MIKITYYIIICSILGVTNHCTDEDIKKYYKRQAVLVHPDKNSQPGAEEAFKILVHAFELIGEPVSISWTLHLIVHLLLLSFPSGCPISLAVHNHFSFSVLTHILTLLCFFHIP